jgi:hypothetical protein
MKAVTFMQKVRDDCPCPETRRKQKSIYLIFGFSRKTASARFEVLLTS